MKTSKKFHERFREVMVEYGKQSDALDKKFDALIADGIEEERAQLESASKPEYPIGTRVWCPKHKRLGTLVEAKIFINVIDDDYYAPRDGPGRYSMGFCDEEWGELARPEEHEGAAKWYYTVQPDPSPVRKRVAATYESFEVGKSETWSDANTEGVPVASADYGW